MGNEPTADEPEDEGAAKHPKIDVSKALGEAGHEVEALGFEGVPDTGPLRRDDDDEKSKHAADAIESDLGTHTVG